MHFMKEATEHGPLCAREKAEEKWELAWQELLQEK
jgi:hypothetical protein